MWIYVQMKVQQFKWMSKLYLDILLNVQMVIPITCDIGPHLEDIGGRSGSDIVVILYPMLRLRPAPIERWLIKNPFLTQLIFDGGSINVRSGLVEVTISLQYPEDVYFCNN